MADPDGARRQAALARYDIFDTPRERDFDDIAILASQICETPIAVVSLLGEHKQWFNAETGFGVRETPLDTSFCRLAILEDDFLLVPDTAADPRFSGNPLVTGGRKLRSMRARSSRPRTPCRSGHSASSTSNPGSSRRSRWRRSSDSRGKS